MNYKYTSSLSFFLDQIQEKKHQRKHKGATGPVHTFVKTDKNANFKWGVRWS